MLCSAHHLFSISFAAAAFSMRGYAFAPSSGKSVSHIIPFSSSDCANALMKNNIEIVAAAVFRLDASFDLGILQAAVTISYSHTPLSHIRTIILNSNTFRADETSGLCECDHNKA
jgi:hypothetical protein